MDPANLRLLLQSIQQESLIDAKQICDDIYLETSKSSLHGIVDKALNIEPKLLFLKQLPANSWIIIGDLVDKVLGYKKTHDVVMILTIGIDSNILDNYNFITRTRDILMKSISIHVGDFSIFTLNFNDTSQMIDFHRHRRLTQCYGIGSNDTLYNFRARSQTLFDETSVITSPPSLQNLAIMKIREVLEMRIIASF